MHIVSELNIDKITEKTIIVYLQNSFGVLENILQVFSERLIPLESINSILFEKRDVYKVTFIVKIKDSELNKIIRTIKNEASVVKVENYDENDMLYYELAFFKISYDYFLTNSITEDIINKHRVKIVEVNDDFIFLEKKGPTEQILRFLKEITPHGLVKFSRSGKVSIHKY